MSSYQGVASTRSEDQNTNGDGNVMRDIHALTPSSHSHHPLVSSLSMATSDDFSNMSATHSTLVVAGSVMGSMHMGLENENENDGNNYEVDHGMPIPSAVGGSGREVKSVEVESKIMAWKNAKISEIMNRFKCEDAIIKGWENEQIQKATLKMKQVERKLGEKKARAVEKMENEIAKAHQKGEERRASAESRRGTKMARVVEVANLMKAVGRSPVKKFF